MEALDMYPRPSKSTLRERYLGKRLEDIDAPAAVVDRSVVKENCQKMLTACREVSVGFRAHVKTHKTEEITRLQVGEASKLVNIVVSTLAEAELLHDFLLTQKNQGKQVNVLLGLPLPPSRASRLAKLGRSLGEGSISVLIDNGDQLEALRPFKDVAGFAAGVFVKIDTGYHRAGIPPSSDSLDRLYDLILDYEAVGLCFLHGLYSHSGHSYHGSSPEEAMKYLTEEIIGLKKAVEYIKWHNYWLKYPEVKQLTLSVGATPSATSIQNLVGKVGEDATSRNLSAAIHGTLPCPCTIELHAGVYTLLDIQQISTRAAPARTPFFHSENQIGTRNLALTILAEVTSVYPDRTPLEALVAAGTLALGREPAEDYEGWAIASDWGVIKTDGKVGSGDMDSGWEVWKISQEHGFLRHKTPASSTQQPAALSEAEAKDRTDGILPWRVGGKVRLWPNHACIAGAMFGFYVVVDRDIDEGQKVVDVWVRCRGW